MKNIAIKMAIILVPSWLTAWIMDARMAYVLPVVVACGLVCATIPEFKKRIDDDGDTSEGD